MAQTVDRSTQGLLRSSNFNFTRLNQCNILEVYKTLYYGVGKAGDRYNIFVENDIVLACTLFTETMSFQKMVH